MQIDAAQTEESLTDAQLVKKYRSIIERHEDDREELARIIRALHKNNSYRQIGAKLGISGQAAFLRVNR